MFKVGAAEFWWWRRNLRHHVIITVRPTFVQMPILL